MVDINTASEAQLKRLPGIGPVIAQRIIQARPFTSVEQLRDVQGIGPKRYLGLCGGCLVTARNTSAPAVNTRRSAVSNRRREPACQPVRGIDINKASLRELQQLAGVGPVIAERIIASRPFYRADEIVAVKGISTVKYEKMKNQLAEVVFENETRDEEPVDQVSPEEPRHSHISIPSEVFSILGRSMAASTTNTDMQSVVTSSTETDPDFGRSVAASTTETDPDLGPVLSTASSSTILGCNSATPTPSTRSQPSSTHTSRAPRQEAFTCTEVIGKIRRNVFPTHRDVRARVLVATWNIRNLSKKKDPVFLNRMVDIIDEFDLIALQEIRDIIVLKRLKNLLPGWDFVVSPAVGGSELGTDTKRSEHFAFLYHRRVFRPTGETFLLKGDNKIFLRSPFVASFDTVEGIGNTPLALTLVNMHVSCGDDDFRQLEMKELHRLLPPLLNDKCPSRNVLVVGDFNLAPHEIACPLKDLAMPVVRAPMATTIFGNLYDNIWLTRSIAPWLLQSGIFRIDKAFYPRSCDQPAPHERFPSLSGAYLARYQCAVELSDHCPVFIAFGDVGTSTSAA
ncbi:hypothetical protein Poli38472_005571 [Pythium oligandrum]|uniref:Endonuclease/exonuclease/phosphatase family domain-containing protein 1 n=1 Tax=Pythium oligandrum TaxID=41045 RepID=A0A8K1FLR6_PYTOL|nr:hypothetical protein Poli38472_005571 [Pythium oligandrum]|eukprot:TMW62953.1 hypothetical protein Poli38472_005571 [Pythium oligandrum]